MNTMNPNDALDSAAATPQSPVHPVAIDGKTFAIGILSVTACILLVGLLLMLNSPSPAFAAGQNDRGGDYIMLTQQLSESTEGVLVIDAAAKAGIIYCYDYNKHSLEKLTPNLRLDKLPGEPKNAPQGGAGRKRGGG